MYCSQIGGYYYGDGNPGCDDACSSGEIAACCLEDSCALLDYTECVINQGGEHYWGEPCSDDLCIPLCPGDLDGDSSVDVNDILLLLGAYGQDDSGDCDGDGDTDVNDVLYLINAWGDCP